LRLRPIAVAAIAAFALLLTAPAPAQDVTVAEAGLKARLVMNLVRFTQWPQPLPDGAALRLCVAAREPLVQAAFATLQGQNAGAYRLEVVPYTPTADCRALFVHGNTLRLPEAPAAGLLTVGDAEGFAARGGMVELVLVNDALRFDANLASLRGAKVNLSSQVLKLARRVIE